MPLGGVACGASYQRVYDGDVRFEHCYRLDSEPTSNHNTRLACWTEWSRYHTTGQTLDRVEYARRRQAALQSGNAALAGPSVITQPGGPGATSLALVLPPQASTKNSADLTPHQQCSQDCGQAFTECITRCDQPACVQRCGNQVRACLDTCL